MKTLLLLAALFAPGPQDAAQDAAEAARPYTERFNAVLSGLAKAAAGSEAAPLLLRGNGRDEVHMLVVMTAERGLCGGSRI